MNAEGLGKTQELSRAGDKHFEDSEACHISIMVGDPVVWGIPGLLLHSRDK